MNDISLFVVHNNPNIITLLGKEEFFHLVKSSDQNSNYSYLRCNSHFVIVDSLHECNIVAGNKSGTKSKYRKKCTSTSKTSHDHCNIFLVGPRGFLFSSCTRSESVIEIPLFFVRIFDR